MSNHHSATNLLHPLLPLLPLPHTSRSGARGVWGSPMFCNSLVYLLQTVVHAHNYTINTQYVRLFCICRSNGLFVLVGKNHVGTLCVRLMNP